MNAVLAYMQIFQAPIDSAFLEALYLVGYSQLPLQAVTWSRNLHPLCLTGCDL